MLLVRTPSPFPDESFSGYLIRVTEENGYSSLSDVLALAGIPTAWNGGWNIDTDRLERILGFETGKLHCIAHSRPDKIKEKALLLGHKVSIRQLNGTRQRICPECVIESGYIAACWDLRLMIACPMHQRMGISKCWQCGKPLSLYRPKMLECECGANLAESLGEPTDAHTNDLMAALSATALMAPIPHSSSCGMPIAEMSAMSIRGLTTSISCLGSQSILSHGLPDSAEPELIAQHAATVLSNWPEGFRALLRRLNVILANTDTRSSEGFIKRFGALYDGLFKRHIPERETDFVRRALVEYGMDEWTEGGIDARLMKGIPMEGRRIRSLAQVAKEMGVMPSTAARMAASGQLPLIVIRDRKRPHIVGEPGVKPPLVRSPGASYGVRDAAELLGMPVSVLKELRKSGHVPTRHMGTHVKCFHWEDLHAFNENCMAAARQSHPATRCDDKVDEISKLVELGHALRTMKFGIASLKHDLVVAVIEGKIPSHGCNADRMGGILLGVAELKSFCLSHRPLDEQDTQSVRETAAIIRCDPTAINSLVSQGYLSNVSGKSGRRITNVSIAAFRNQFVALSDIAKRHATSPKRVAVHCLAMGIKRVVAKRTHSSVPQCFVSRESAESLECHLRSQDAMAEQAEEANDKGQDPVDVLKRYLDGLRKSGSRLPRRNRLPNKSAIALACGLKRDIFRSKSWGTKLLDEFDEEDRARAGIQAGDPVGSLKKYLDDLARSRKPLPRHQRGRPNKREIAKACQFRRSVFYEDADIAAVLDEYDRGEPRYR